MIIAMLLNRLSANSLPEDWRPEGHSDKTTVRLTSTGAALTKPEHLLEAMMDELGAQVQMGIVTRITGFGYGALLPARTYSADTYRGYIPFRGCLCACVRAPVPIVFVGRSCVARVAVRVARVVHATVWTLRVAGSSTMRGCQVRRMHHATDAYVTIISNCGHSAHCPCSPVLSHRWWCRLCCEGARRQLGAGAICSATAHWHSARGRDSRVVRPLRGHDAHDTRRDLPAHAPR